MNGGKGGKVEEREGRWNVGSEDRSRGREERRKRGKSGKEKREEMVEREKEGTEERRQGWKGGRE